MEKKQILEKTRQCNVTYRTLGETDRSAMPIGNGELAASVWVNKKQDICFYLSRTDALTELDRTVKLGLFEITLEPCQFQEGAFSQQLLLEDGVIEITGKNGKIRIWIDSNKEIFCLDGDFEEKVRAEIRYINWRKEEHSLEGEFWEHSQICESGDHIEKTGNSILFYHENKSSIVKETAQLQELGDYVDLMPDLLDGRIFGGLTDLRQDGKHISFEAATLSGQMERQQFICRLEEVLNEHCDLEKSLEETRKHWNDYWCKSYIFVSGDTERTNLYLEELKELCREPVDYECAEESQITKAYMLTKYMNACCNSGAFPVLYNGLLFNLCAGGMKHFRKYNMGAAFTEQPGEITKEYNPDERSWCTEQLWQNVRHPYYSLLERGEGEKLKVLFNYYRRFWEINRVRARKFFGASGQHNTEMTMSCGLQSPTIYGIDREGRPAGYADNRWGGAVDISPGLELANLMLDYYDFYKDEEFLLENLEYIRDLLVYTETRFPETDGGKMQIGPINAIETYRDTINPITITAGLRRVVGRILELGREHISDIGYYEEYAKKIPEIPYICQGAAILEPADIYEETRYNVEIPELYACYPFREYTFYKENADLARHTYFIRTEQYGLRRCFEIGEDPDSPSYSGWQNLGVVAAVLGLKEEAALILENNCSLQNPGTRFPAMWGPVYDAVPDTDHGANILNQLQKMTFQSEGEKIYVVPALPEKWSVEFKLYADAETSVEARYVKGRLEELTVLPQERRKDVLIKETVEREWKL